MNFRRIYVEFVMTLMFAKEFTLNLLRLVNMGRNRYLKDTKLDGKVVVITGANTGIGKRTAYHLSLRGAKVIMCSRDVTKGAIAARDIRAQNPKAVIEVMQLNLSSLSSIRRFAKELKERESKIDILVNNAGVMMCPKMTTDDGFELQLGTNHLGHFLLTLLLIDTMKTSSDARIITVSSMHGMRGQIHFDDINLDSNYSPLDSYCQSKLANILFTRELAKRLSDWPNIKAYVLHPGTITTDLFRHLSGITAIIYRTIGYLFNIDTELGVQTTLYCALDPDIRHESGHYYNNCRKDNCLLREATDDRSARRLWQLSQQLVDLDDNYRI
ncbi:retinol dehydrogenase 12-like [Oppia nitens]|uniref:retinol dehydrogenase 12-like n=1 Tax=Oppia nitens TaxID=1686743 RepID=UPI0023DC52F5|nr:retinol dehydrogenase 12-like [Oppia nitens]